MTVAVYGRQECVQCRYTREHLDAAGVAYEYFDVYEDSYATDTVKAFGNLLLPLVIVTDAEGRVINRWNGFHIDKIKGLS